MNHFLESKIIIGINAPIFAWVAVAIVTVFAVMAIMWLSVRIRLISASSKRLSRLLSSVKAPTLGSGLSLPEVERIRGYFEKTPRFRGIWMKLQSNLIRRGGAREDEYWLSVPASELVESTTVTDFRINREWYGAIPGILTGFGLSVTFIAILAALLHVSVDSNNQVQGIQDLIKGLSGKFVSSIAALLASTIFIIFEKHEFHWLDKAVSTLGESLSEIIPVLTPTHVLVELQKDMGEQSVAFRAFNADLSGRLKQSFSESMGPTLQRMVGAVEELNQLLRAAEAAKSDTISESLAGMISRLEGSLTQSLGRMGEQFTSSLSGTTMNQFSRLSESLAGAASVLEQMNSQNQATQAALTELVNFAKNSASEQMALGRTQVEDLTNVLRSMLVQIEQATGSSVNNMGAALTALMADLSSKVAELNEQTRTSMVQTSQASADAANSVLKNASDWTATSTDQLAALIEKHTNQLSTADRLRAALDDSATRFTAAASQFSSILTKLQQVATDAGTCTTAMSGAAKLVRDVQETLKSVAGLSSLQVEKLSLAGKEQQELLARISQAMAQYQQTFSKVETSASALLQTLERNLLQHVELCKRGYESLAKVSDEHFASATQRLGASVDELSEYLQDLSDVMAARSSGKAGHGD